MAEQVLPPWALRGCRVASTAAAAPPSEGPEIDALDGGVHGFCAALHVVGTHAVPQPRVSNRLVHHHKTVRAQRRVSMLGPQRRAAAAATRRGSVVVVVVAEAQKVPA